MYWAKGPILRKTLTVHTGLVIKSTGSWYKVKSDDGGDVVKARMRGRIRLEGMPVTNPIAVGDRVQYEIKKGEAVIRHILPRTNYLARQSPRNTRHLHLLGANVDQAVLVVTVRYPNLKLGFIDRFLLMTEPQDIPVIILINKMDLMDEEDLELAGGLQLLYEGLGYRVLPISAKQGEGLDILRQWLQGKQSLLSGQSGVGKSTLLNSLKPDLQLKTKELSRHTGKGQHSTTFAEMHFLDADTRLIDSPGIKKLSFNNLEPQQVAHNFREFFALSPNCKFGGACLHRQEPGCAVKAALESGQISDLRYTSYLQILEEIESQKHWQRHKDW